MENVTNVATEVATDNTPMARANFSQLAMEAPEAQAAATAPEFDNLFAHLEPPASDQEKAYRVRLFETKNGYKRSRYVFGEALHTYWFWCMDTKQVKATTAQKATFGGLCDLIGVERRTAYNIMDDYRRAKPVHADFREVAEKHNIDLAERRNAELAALLLQHPDLPRTADVAEQATAVFVKAQKTVAALKSEREQKLRAAQNAEARKSLASKLYEFVEALYAGQPVDDFRRDMEEVTKRIARYMRSDDNLPTLDELRKRRESEAKAA